MDIRDVSASLSRFVERRAAELGYQNIKIYPGPSIVPQDRPVWIIQSLPGALGERMTKYTVHRIQRFNIMFLASGGIKGYYDALKWNAHVEKKLAANNWKMTSILVDFVFPQSASRVLEGEGSLNAGTYYYSVTGINHIDETEETLPSVVQSVVVDENGSCIEIVIPRHDGGMNWFRKYNVYAGNSPTNLRKISGMPIEAYANIPTLYRIQDIALANGGSAPTESMIKYRFLEIPPDAFDSSVTDEPTNEAGNYMGLISLNIRYPLRTSDPLMEPAFPVTQVNYEIFRES